MEIQHFSHQHSLVLCEKLKIHGAKCAGCELPVRGQAFDCRYCKYCIHKTCSEVPLEIHHPLHPPHPLTLLSKPPYESGKFTCYFCDESCGGFTFHCKECEFDLDIECALQTPVIDHKIQGNEIQHVSHKHALTESNSCEYDGIRCSGCELRIDCPAPAYVCTGCKFFLHKSCSELPEKIRHHFDTATTFVLSPYCGTLFICQACGNDSRGFKYLRYSGGMDIDLDCASLKASLKVDDHKHRLTLFEKKVHGMKCNACGTRCNSHIFRCVKCNFNLHFSCGPISQTIKHECHIHPLTLTKFDDEDDKTDYYCHACENRRNPGSFVYHCAACRFTAHISCVISEVVPSSLSQEDEEIDPPEPKGIMHLEPDPFLVRYDYDIDEVNEELEKAKARLQELEAKRAESVDTLDPHISKLDEEIVVVRAKYVELGHKVAKLERERSRHKFEYPLADMP